MLNEFQPPTERRARAYSFVAPQRNQVDAPDDTAELTIPIGGVQAGTYLVRAHVDGAESPLTVNELGQYATPQVTIP
jgi:hypothetical protein